MRQHLTEDEHELASKLRTEFCIHVARAAADVLQKFDEESRKLVRLFLQDELSLYSPFTSDRIDHELEILDATRNYEYGKEIPL